MQSLTLHLEIPSGPGRTYEAEAGTAIQTDSTTPPFHICALDTLQTTLDASCGADEPTAHLSGLLDASVAVTLKIEAAVPEHRSKTRRAYRGREGLDAEFFIVFADQLLTGSLECF